jgi:hypothetical protein
MNREEVEYRRSTPKEEHARMKLGKSFPQGGIV